MGRLVVVALGLLVIACGSRVESGVSRVDPLLAVERDPQAALAAAKHPTYRATYQMTLGSSFAAPLAPSASPGPLFAGSQTYVARPPDFRWEFSLAGLVQFQTIAIVRGTDAYVCVESGTPACFAVPATNAQEMLDALNVSPLDAMQSAAKDMDATVLPRERIAGVDAACFRWRPRVTASATPSPNALFGQLGDMSVEGCFSADGVMLRSLTSAGSLFTVEQRATSVSATVTDADFALPYPVTSAPFQFPTSAPFNLPTPRPTPTH